MLIRIGHTPNPDDAFMYWALAAGEVDTHGFEFEPIVQNIETLNGWAREGSLELTALSAHTYPFVQERYILLPHGASVGGGYGPVVVSAAPLSHERLREVEIVVPDTSITSFLVLRMFLGEGFRYRVLPRERIVEEVTAGRAEAGLVIETSPFAPATNGLVKSVDLGEWWLLETGLPLPLTVNAVRRDLGAHLLSELSEVVRESILVGLDNRQRALAYAMRFGCSADGAMVERYVDMYAGELSFDFGEEGRQAISELLRRGEAIGALDGPVTIDFVG